MNLKNPLRISHFVLLLQKFGILSETDLGTIVDKEKSLETFQNDVFRILEIIRTTLKEEWIHIKQIEKIMNNRGIELNKSELENVLLLMENKLLELIISKKQKHKEYRINPNKNDFDMISSEQKLRKMLKEYLLR
jgi:hypothetical protein